MGLREPDARSGSVDTDDPEVGNVRIAVAFLTAVALLVASDLLLDSQAGAEPLHLAVEGLIMVVSAGGAAWLGASLRRARRSVVALERDIDAARSESRRWRAEAREALEGLGASLGRQFDRWDLTEAERQVALLLLKGLSHRHAARIRTTSERTVRQQAREVYRKAGLSGRSELAAFFLEDLLVPPGEDADHPDADRTRAPTSDVEADPAR